MRVVDYSIDDGRGDHETYRLLTTILDPTEASAEELALAYGQRWEIESAFDELKTHQRGPPGPCCARSHPSSSIKRSGDTCAVTTPSAP